MKLKKLFLLALIIPLFAFSAHKYYLSLTQIEYNSKSKSIEVIINVFIDDIETTLNKLHNKRFALTTKNEPEDSDIYFEEYLQEHLKFKLDNKSYNFNYLGKEYDGDVVFFYLEIKDVAIPKNIDVNSTILLADFPTQQNLVRALVN